MEGNTTVTQTKHIQYRIRYFSLCLVVTLLSACVSPLELTHTKTDSYNLYTTTAANSSLIIRNKNDSYTFCSEPQPDAAYDHDNSLSFSLALLKNADNTDDSRGINEVGLGGLSTNVLLTRETFYRSCEFMANNNLTAQQRLDLFNNVLDTVKTINSQNLGTGTTSQAGVKATNNVTPVPPATTE